MIWETKAMIAGCIDRMSRSACNGCERRDACASLFANLFGTKPRWRLAERPEWRQEPKRAHPFLALLGQVARAIEEGSKAAAGDGSAREDGGTVPANGFR